MAIEFKPFDELFAHEYQLTHISTIGNIDIGSYTYNVFRIYTPEEQQFIFQLRKKHLPWETSEEQEHWERAMYVYQFLIKGPFPFPYEEYTLSPEIEDTGSMSDYHIKTVQDDRTQIEVVFHIAVPNENNFVGVNLQTAMTQYRPSPGSAVPWQQSGTEYDAIQNGEIYEKSETYKVESGLTKTQIRDRIDARFTALNNKVPDKIRALLDFWGLDRDVP